MAGKSRCKLLSINRLSNCQQNARPVEVPVFTDSSRRIYSFLNILRRPRFDAAPDFTASGHIVVTLLCRHGVIAGAVTDLQLSRIGIILGGGVNLDFNAAEIRIREPRTGIVRNQVLGAQLIADLAKGSVQLLQPASIEVLAAGVARQLDKRVFAADVAAGAVFYRHDDDAVQNDFGLLRLAYGLLVTRLADRVAAVGNDDHHFAAATIKQRVGAKIQRVIQRGGRS